MVTAPPLPPPPCAAHAKVEAAAACSGCGLFLCAPCSAHGGRCGRCRGEPHPVPWEDAGRGRVDRFLGTLGALARDRLFPAAPWTGGLAAPLRFAVVAATVGAVFAALWGLLGGVAVHALLRAAVEPLAASPPRELDPAVRDALRLAPRLLDDLHLATVRMTLLATLLAPLSALVEVLVASALGHAVARALGGHGSFEATLRVTAYAAGAKVLQALPGVGGTLAPLAGVVLLTAGVRRAHGLSTLRAFVVAVWWVPLVVLLACLFVALVVGQVATHLR